MTVFDEALREKAARMIEVMQAERGVGLAAPQVAWDARLLLASADGEPESTRVYVNPEILDKGGGTEWGEEGCLSFPEVYGEVLRHRKVVVKAQDVEGREITEEAEGFYARVLQHEIDHINGVVFISRMRPGDKQRNRARIEEMVSRWLAENPEAAPPVP